MDYAVFMGKPTDHPEFTAMGTGEYQKVLTIMAGAMPPNADELRCTRDWHKLFIPYYKQTPLYAAYNMAHPERSALTVADFVDAVTFFRAIGRDKYNAVASINEGIALLREYHPLFIEDTEEPPAKRTSLSKVRENLPCAFFCLLSRLPPFLCCRLPRRLSPSQGPPHLSPSLSQIPPCASSAWKRPRQLLPCPAGMG